MTYHVRCRGEHPDWLMNAYDGFLDENGIDVAHGTRYSAWELFEMASNIKLIYRGTEPHMIEFKDRNEATLFLLRWA